MTGDKPHVRDLLRRVAAAGDAGLTAADLEPGARIEVEFHAGRVEATVDRQSD